MHAIDTQQAREASTSRRTISDLARFWAIGTAMAVLLVVSAYLLAEAMAGPMVVTGAGEVTVGNVIGFTVFGATVGAVLAYVSGRLARRPRLVFLAVTLTALAGYAVVPFTAAQSFDTAIWLNVLHLVVAVPVIGALTRYLPRSRILVEA